MDTFYDDLAEYYHLIFEDWSRSMERQAAVLGPLLERYTGRRAPRVLDCACGIGTQTLGLAARGHDLVGSDLSRASVARAQREARLRALEVPLHVADMRDLSSLPAQNFDAVLAADNALPHLLLKEDRDRALREMADRLRPDGILAVTLRDYDRLIQTRPTMQEPSFFGERSRRRIVHQVWDWEGTEYDVHLYISFESGAGWVTKHFVSRYHALLREDLNASLRTIGFTDIQWLEPDVSSFYQPVVIARR